VPAATSPALGVALWESDPRALRAKAAGLEQLGFAAITIGDHLVARAIAPLIACAIVADATERVRVGPLVLNNDFRHPVVLAREAAALAELSGGRFELGLGAGFAAREYERAGIPFAPRRVRAARLAESAHVIRGLLAGETVTFAGEHYVVRGETLTGPPPAVPILIGGNSRDVHAAAAAHADIVGLCGLSPTRGGTETDMSDFSTAGLERQVDRLRELAGPRFSQLELHALVQWHEVTGDRRAAAERAAPQLEVSPEVALDSPYVLLGTPEEIAAQLREHHDRFGITRWTVFGDRPDLPPAEALVPVLERLAGE
jgi:probable F420-dependent oxidoreductase